MMQPPSPAQSPGLLQRATSLFSGVLTRGASADADPPPKVMDLGDSGGFHWDEEKKRWIFDDQEEEEEEDVKPPPRPVVVSNPRERGRVTGKRFVDPFAGQTPEKQPENTPSYNNKQDDDDQLLDDEEEDFMQNRRYTSDMDDFVVPMET